MNKWTRLAEWGSDISRGQLVRFVAGEAFEGTVVMMVCEPPDRGEGLALMAITGYKAGINCYVVLPAEAGKSSLSVSWLAENWGKWVWPGGDVAEVFVRSELGADEL